MDCTTCARFEINCDKALTDDSYFCNEYLDLRKLHKMQLEVPVRGGTLKASSSGDPENPGIVIMYQPHNANFDIDICYVENTSLQYLSKEDACLDEKDLRVFNYGDVFSEDWTEKHIICNTAIEAMLKEVEE